MGTIEVALKISETGDFIASSVDLMPMKALSTAGTTTTFSVATADPVLGGNEDDSVITVEILDGENYTLANSPGHKASVTATDGDFSSVASIMTTFTEVADTDYFTYTLTLDPAPQEQVTVNLTLPTPTDFPLTNDATAAIVFEAGEASKTLQVNITETYASKAGATVSSFDILIADW